MTIPVWEMAARLAEQLPPAGQLGPPSQASGGAGRQAGRSGNSAAAGSVGSAALDEWHRLIHFLQVARSDGLDVSERAAVVEDGPAPAGTILWTILSVRSLGRTSLLILGPLPGLPADYADFDLEEESAKCAESVANSLRQAVALLVEQERLCNVALLQTLLLPTQTAEGRLLRRCGLSRLAELIYMQGDLPGDPGLSPPGPLDLWPTQRGDCERTYTQDNAQEFVRAIQASYVHTLDCPALEGVRRMDDVLAGHRGSGLFRPDLWFLFLRAGQPIGVVLLNEVLDGSHGTVELVYMGLPESARGQGLGRRMFHFAMRSAWRAGFRRILTAVDSQNLPAVRLYSRLGLTETMRRVAFILPLNRAKGGSGGTGEMKNAK